MKFKTKPGHNPTLKFKDKCGDKLHAFLIPEAVYDNDDYTLVLWTDEGARVGMNRKKAVKFAKAILIELGTD